MPGDLTPSELPCHFGVTVHSLVSNIIIAIGVILSQNKLIWYTFNFSRLSLMCPGYFRLFPTWSKIDCGRACFCWKLLFMFILCLKSNPHSIYNWLTSLCLIMEPSFIVFWNIQTKLWYGAILSEGVIFVNII